MCGVIDWGDVHLGDPALDLSIAFSFLPPGARAAFREAYGPIDAATWDRARFRALHYAVLLSDYGADVGGEAIRAAGEYALWAASA
jgi:aminoglycoside phosphotransferase (APT) family kinase protein